MLFLRYIVPAVAVFALPTFAHPAAQSSVNDNFQQGTGDNFDNQGVNYDIQNNNAPTAGDAKVTFLPPDVVMPEVAPEIMPPVPATVPNSGANPGGNGNSPPGGNGRGSGSPPYGNGNCDGKSRCSFRSSTGGTVSRPCDVYVGGVNYCDNYCGLQAGPDGYQVACGRLVYT